jgi:hypothetical protein
MSYEIDERPANSRDETARSLAAAIAAARSQPPLDTHWSRILHHDVFNAEGDGAGERPGRTPLGEQPDTLARIARTPLRATAIALGAYAAMHLAVAGVLHVLHAPESAAALLPLQAQQSASDSKHAHASGGHDAR